MAYVFAACVLIVTAGVIWFHIVRPILEDYEVISVNDNADVMSRERGEGASERAPSAVETDSRQSPDRPTIAQPTPAQMLDIFKVLRAAGVKREELRPAWRAAGLALDNNLWSQAAPPPPEEPQTVTPIAGRATSARFHDDPELEYEPLR